MMETARQPYYSFQTKSGVCFHGTIRKNDVYCLFKASTGSLEGQQREHFEWKIIAKKSINKHMALPLFLRFANLFRSRELVFSHINYSKDFSDHSQLFSLTESSLGLWPNKSYLSRKSCWSHFPTRARLHILNIRRRGTLSMKSAKFDFHPME